MKKHLIWLACGAAFLGMGLSMPNCPGQQAMQQQVDALQAKNAELTKHAQTLDSQVRTLNNELSQVKTLLAQVSNTVLAQKQAIEQIDAAMKAAAAKPAAKSATKAPSRPSAKSKPRRH